MCPCVGFGSGSERRRWFLKVWSGPPDINQRCAALLNQTRSTRTGGSLMRRFHSSPLWYRSTGERLPRHAAPSQDRPATRRTRPQRVCPQPHGSSWRSRPDRCDRPCCGFVERDRDRTRSGWRSSVELRYSAGGRGRSRRPVWRGRRRLPEHRSMRGPHTFLRASTASTISRRATSDVPPITHAPSIEERHLPPG